MVILNVNKLSMAFGENQLFNNVSFNVKSAEKVGLIGANGVGKTTLFKIINKDLSPTEGNISVAKDTKVGYMEQHTCTNPNRTVKEELLSVFTFLKEMELRLSEISALIDAKDKNTKKLILEQSNLLEKYQRMGGLTYKSRVNATLIGLGFTEENFTMETGKLSGGEQSKLSLAKLLLSNNDLLLLDEPTNHLDINAVIWLEDFIKNFSGTVIVISHDRYFLDATTNKTIELEHNKAICFEGNYSNFLKKKKQMEDSIEKQYINEMNEIKRIEGIIEQQRRWGRQRNIITAESREKQVAKLKEKLVIPEKELSTIKINFTPKQESGNDVLICTNLSKSFNNKNIFNGIDLHINKGEKIFLLGANGSGKTTLFKIINKECIQDTGSVKLGSRVDVGYFDQMQDNLTLSKTAFDEIHDAFPSLTETEVRTSLAAFLFKGNDVFKKISKMSGGERARISLLKLMLAKSNFLLLDEPTNHLDTQSRENLENTLLNYEGTLLIISHDRYFINKLSDKILELTSGGINEYLGNYDYYVEKTDSINKTGQNFLNKGTNTSKEKPKTINKYELRKQKRSDERRRKSQIKRIESEILVVEEKIEKAETLLQKDEITSNYEKLLEITNNLESLHKKEKSLYKEWEQLHTE